MRAQRYKFFAYGASFEKKIFCFFISAYYICVCGSHNEKADYDAQRDKYLEGLGLKVFHTTDYDVLQHVNIMLSDLRNYIVDNYEHEDYEKKE